MARRRASTRTGSAASRPTAAQPRDHRHVRAGLDVQARHRLRRALRGARLAARRRSRCRTSIQVADRVIHDARPARDRAADCCADPRRTRRTSARSRSPRTLGPDRLAALDRPLRLRQAHRDRLPRRGGRRRAAAGSLVRLDDRQRPDRPGDRGHPDADGRGYAAIANGGAWIAAAPRRRGRRRPRQARRNGGVSSRHGRRAGRDDAARRRRRRAPAPAPQSPATRSRARPAPRRSRTTRRLLDLEVRRLVRRLRPGEAPRLAILVMVDEPKGAILGGVVAAPAFQEIARFGLQYLEVPPDAPVARPQLRLSSRQPSPSGADRASVTSEAALPLEDRRRRPSDRRTVAPSCARASRRYRRAHD